MVVAGWMNSLWTCGKQFEGAFLWHKIIQRYFVLKWPEIHRKGKVNLYVDIYKSNSD